MRCIIARFPFDLTRSQVLEAMKGVKPEPVTGESVIIGRRQYPVKQAGEVITGQDRRDFTAAEVTRAMKALGFTCRTPGAPESVWPMVQAGSRGTGTAPLRGAQGQHSEGR